MKKKRRLWPLDKKTLKRVEYSLDIFLVAMMLIVSVSGLVLGTYMFVGGFHNVDRGFNVKWLNDVYNMSFMERTNLGNILDSTELITLGYNQQDIGFMTVALSAFFLGCVFVVVMMIMYQRVERIR